MKSDNPLHLRNPQNTAMRFMLFLFYAQCGCDEVSRYLRDNDRAFNWLADEMQLPVPKVRRILEKLVREGYIAKVTAYGPFGEDPDCRWINATVYRLL
jgi:hypothetical protein